MKKSLLFIFVFSFFVVQNIFEKAIAQTPKDELEASYAQTAASYTNYKDCIKLYKLPSGKMFFLALSAVNGTKYEIVEMQSRSGYIIFKAEGREFLLSVFRKDKNYTFLKISPCDNNYYFSPLIPQKIFNYVAHHFNDDVKEVKF